MKPQKEISYKNPLSKLKVFYAFFIALLLLSACNGSRSSDEGLKATWDFGNGESKEQSVTEPAPPVITESGTYAVTVSDVNGASNANYISDKKDEDGREETNEPEKLITKPPTDDIKIPEKIKKTADINLTVDDYKVARLAIEKVVKSGHAYISAENEQNSTYSISNTMIIRVLNKDFDGMVNNITGIASHVNSKNIYTEDVTAQFVDITARLKSKKEVEKRYIDLLQKATKVGEILEVEQNLRVIREEIEAKEGELKYLNNQVNYSTINLSVHQDFEYQPQDEPGFFGRLGHAFGNGWKGFLSFLVGIAYAWPLWIILGIGTYVLVKFVKRQLKKK